MGGATLEISLYIVCVCVFFYYYYYFFIFMYCTKKRLGVYYQA